MATIRDVAKKAGVSIAAVSRILNMDETLSVSNETKRKVFKAADDLKYVKKVSKNGNSNKRADKRPIVGIVNRLDFERELEDVYFMSVRLAIEEKLTENGFRVFNINPNSNYSIELEPRLDGCIILGKLEDEQLDELKISCDNIVIIDSRYLRPDADYVSVDLGSATEEVMDYLYGLGHRRIAIIADKTPEDIDKEKDKLDARIRGYVSYMYEKGIYDESLFIKVPYFSNINAYEALKSKMTSGIIPTAVISCNDSMATGAYKAINEAGMTIGKDISVVGFNDQSTAEYMIPSLTTVRLPMKNMGYEAVNLLKEQMMDTRDYKKVVLLKTELIIRDSTRECSVKNQHDS